MLDDPPRSAAEMITAGRYALPTALCALVLLGVALLYGIRPPSAKPETAPPAEFSAGRAVRLLERVLADGAPHPVGSAANAAVRERIVGELERLGYAVQVQRALSCRAGGLCAFVENIVTRVPGRDGAGGGRNAVMLASHYDSRGAGVGAGDAGASVAAILEVARIISEEAPFRNDVIVLLTDGEEMGLLGAEAFVREHPWAGDVALVINLEARGTAGPSIMFETSAQNRWLVREFGRAVARPVASSLTYDVYRLLPNDTDATVFRRAGMDVLNFAFIGGLVRYHTARDDIAHLDLRSLQHHGDNALGAVRHFATIPLEPPGTRSGDAAYADLFGSFLLQWPVSWQLPLSVLLAAVIVAAAVLLVLRRRLRVSQLGWGVLATTLGLVAGVVSGFAFGALLSAVTGRAGVYHAYPQPATIALWGAAITLVLGAGVLFARRAGSAGLFTGAWLVIALLTVAVAAPLPGVAVVLVIPLLVGAGAVFTSAVWARSGSRMDVMVMTAALGAALTLVPLAALVQSAFVLQMPFAITAIVGIAALPLLPLTAVATDAMRPLRTAVAGAAVVVVAAAVLALIVPGFSRSAPEPMNLVYIEDASVGEAVWVVQGLRPNVPSLPAELRAAADFRDDEPPDWLPPFVRGPWAPAPPAGLPQPRIERLAEDASANGRGERAIMIRLLPAAAGNRLVLTAPGRARAQSGGQRLPSSRSRATGRALWVFFGVPEEGMLITLVLPAGETGSLVLHEFGSTAAMDDALPGARPEHAAPFADGDVAVSVVRHPL